MFENEYLMDKKMIKEYVIGIISKRTILLGLVLFVAGLVLYFAETDNMRYAMLTCSFLGIFCAICTPIIMINNFEKAAKRLNNGKIEKTKLLFDNNIILDEGKVHMEFEYSQILGITQSKSFLFLEMGNKSGILVSKTGFTKGTLDDFIKFIQEKINKEG